METGTSQNQIVPPQLMIGHAKAGEVIPSILVTLLGLGFYAAHQAWSTGFFTTEFTSAMAVLLYSSILFGIVTAVSKVLTVRKGLLALVNLVSTGLVLGAVSWLFFAFPLNFAHLADVLPVQVQFVLSWVTNDIGRIVLGIAIIGSLIAFAVYSVKLALARLA